VAIGEAQTASRRPFGVRLYLAIAFALVALVTAGLAVLLASGTPEDVNERAEAVTVGRTISLADEIGDRAPQAAPALLADAVSDPGFSSWAFGPGGNLITPESSRGMELADVPGYRRAVHRAVAGSRSVESLPDGVTLVATPVFRDGALDGAVLARAEQPEEIQTAVEDVGGDRLTAALIALGVAILVSFLAASAITTRVKRLAESAARISEGRLDEPLEGTGGRDEITDLGNALETMRSALRETFGALRSERDRLSAIFDALDDAVMVVGADGAVRFCNASGEALIGADHKVPGAFLPWLNRARGGGTAEHDGLRVGDRVYAIRAHQLPAEDAVLAVVRDRTEELRRELAEREFVSNAAHELRNPIAGISGSIEVLAAGAKDDPEAREHFLNRLSDDVDRVSRLTESLLTLARVEAIGESGVGSFDASLAVEEAVQAVAPPEGIEVQLELEPELVAEGDAVLLRQVLIGLLTNAFKNTPAPGHVGVRASRDAGNDGRPGFVLVEVSDSGSGIAPDELNRIFERFYRGAGALEQEGFGLGLSIAKRMVDVMGGQIGVRSEVGVGSTFWIRLTEAEPAATPVA
jgi:signal transduction histidine kinase/HAMP domain-containing protein